jgi:hypothetical protein
VYATQTTTGDRKKIQAVIMKSSVGSALFSKGTISIGGSADIQWGPVVSYSTASNSIPSPMNHPVYISAGGIGGALPNCSDPMAGVCVKEYATDLGDPPVFPLDEMRSIAKGQGTYQGGGGACYSVNDSLLGSKQDDTVVFWDTCDGKDFDPVADTTCSSCGAHDRGVSVKLTGGWGGKGTLVVMGDLDTKGTNAQPTVMIPPPDCSPKYGTASDCNNGNPMAATVMWDGLIYIAGSLSSAGNKSIYGSVYAYDTAGVGGNFSLYFKYNNKGNGFLGTSLLTKLWLERRPTKDEVDSGYFDTE